MTDIVERLRREYEAIGCALNADAADEIERLRQQLAECERELDRCTVAIVNAGNRETDWKNKLATVTKERDELVAAATKFLTGYDCQEPHQGLIVEGIEMMREALAKLGAEKGDEEMNIIEVMKGEGDVMHLEVERFINADGTFSHYSVVQVENDEIVELATCVMHETKDEAEQELQELK